jgi:hypothetical protein
MFTQKRRVALTLAGIIGVSVFMSSVILASPIASAQARRDDRLRDRSYYRHGRSTPRKTLRIRFSDKDVDRLIAIGGIYFVSKAISELGRRPQEVVHVSPPSPRYSGTPSPQPTYTSSVCTTAATVRNATGWYIAVAINGRQFDLYPGGEESVSWTYTGREHDVCAWAYQDPYRRQLVGTYRGNLIGYEIPWVLNFDHTSFVRSVH